MATKERKVIQKVKGVRAVDGAGVSLVRVLGNETVYDFDPFLMLDSFDSTNPMITGAVSRHIRTVA